MITKTFNRSVLMLFLPLLLAACNNQNKINLPEDAVVSLVREAYLYAMPLVYTDVTRSSYPFPDNYLHHKKEFPDHTFRNVVAPNNDTNYSIGFLQLGEEPVVVELPDTEGRYYVFPLLDAWTNNFSMPGKRTSGTGEQKYLVSGPGWQGEVPEGLSHIQSPTNLVWIIGRIQVNGPEDQQEVVSPLQEKFVLLPLSAWLSAEGTAPQLSTKKYGNYLPQELTGTNVVELVKGLSLENYFNYFNELLADNPPLPADSTLVNRIARVGIGAGKHFSLDNFNESTQKALANVVDDIYKELDNPTNPTTLFGNNTAHPDARLGDYYTDYNTRALVAYRGLGALPPEEAVYYSYYTDTNNEPLDGKYTYRIHFPKGGLPPAEAFWSYTVYDNDRYLIDNPIRRYAIGDRNPLKYNPDGSLDLYLSVASPGKEKEANWLPVPDAPFNITTRIYIPAQEFLNNRTIWSDPSPEKITDK